jgi:cell shape-determining protein MreC
MITSWRHDEQKKNKRRKILGVILLVSLLLLSLRGPVANTLGGLFALIGRPFWFIRDTVVTKYDAVATALSSKAALEAENDYLKEVLDEISLEAYSRDQLRKENDDLKAMLGREGEYTYTLGRILSAPPVSPYDTLLIDAGEEQGVFVGMEAFSQGDFKVGEVSRVWGRTSLVSLYSTPNTQLSVTIGSSSIPAVAWGLGGGNLRVILPRGVAVKQGDIIAIPALSPEYAGTVDAIDRPEGSSLEAIYIRLPFDVYKEKWVYLATPKVASKEKARL